MLHTFLSTDINNQVGTVFPCFILSYKEIIHLCMTVPTVIIIMAVLIDLPALKNRLIDSAYVYITPQSNKDLFNFGL